MVAGLWEKKGKCDTYGYAQNTGGREMRMNFLKIVRLHGGVAGILASHSCGRRQLSYDYFG